MRTGKLHFLRDFLIRNSKIAFPLILIAAVAATVAVALGASGNRKIDELLPEQLETEEETPGPAFTEGEIGEVPLLANEDSAIETLITEYYNAQATGDLEKLTSLCDMISEKDLLLYRETARYIDSYPTIEIYTKPGYAEGETIAYVYFKMLFVNHEEEFPGYQAFYICTAEDGSRYIMRSDGTEEANQYAMQISEQDDVIEFMNRIVAEYDEFKEQHPEMASYPEEVTAHVRVAVGEILSAQQTANGGGTETETGGAGQTQPEPVQEPAVQYAVAVTTVNVRSSDSEKADRLGQVAGGTKLQVLEVRVNGWTKVIYEKKEGYIKSSYLQMQENVADLPTIGTVTATTTINVRAAASQSAQKLGVLREGDSAELVVVEGEWCKIKYNNQVAYVKAEYVKQQ